MQPGPYELVKQQPDETALLQTIYNKRFTFIISVYIALIVMAGRLVSPGLFTNVVGQQDPVEYQRIHTTDKDLGISPFQMVLLATLYIEGPIVITFFVFFFTKVYTFRKDIKSGLKEKVPYVIQRKEYFPLTSQYFVALDDADYMHHEIDVDTYNQVSEGDYIYLYRTIYSKYVFENNGRFTIL